MNIARYLEESARRYPHKTAVRHEGEEITFEELDKACNRLANGLKDLGLEPGDRSVLMMPNSIHAITAYYALAKIGAVVVPVNFLYRAHELEHIFTDSKPKSFIGAEPHLDEIANLLKKIEGKPPLLLALGATDSRFKDLKTAYSDRADFPTHPSGDTDTFNILYTSGTTGVPKGVMLTHGNLAKDAEILAEMRGEIEPDTVVIGALPLYHVYGITSVLNVSMYLGFTIELFTHFDPEAVIRVTEEEARTLFFGVPTMLNRLIQVASEKPPERTSLKFCISGGASLPVEFLKRFETLFNTTIHEGYGLTECPVCVENPYGKKTKPGSIGLPIPEFSARIVGEDGKDVSPGEKGELLIKGPAVMKGYLNRPEETAETIRDGWLYTGDIARMDEDLYIYIVDRKKELVIRGGYNVYPREIEEILYQIPDILEAAVYGVPHEDLGEEVAAVVVLKEGAQTDGNAIREYVKERLAPYKYPRIIKTVKDPLPKSGSGKILKKEVKKIYASFD
ncbi:MAG: long-chain fatty acid--CoA ligase [Pseudomonadota bacterium]